MNEKSPRERALLLLKEAAERRTAAFEKAGLSYVESSEWFLHYRHKSGAGLDLGLERYYFNIEMWVKLPDRKLPFSVAALFSLFDPINQGFDFRRISDYLAYAPEAKQNKASGVKPDAATVELYLDTLCIFLERYGERAFTNEPPYAEQFLSGQQKL